MELCKEILAHVLTCADIKLSISGLNGNIAEVVEGECYKALQKIKSIIEDDRLGDKECLIKIEEIVCVLESIGSDGGTRHDFG